MAIRTVVTGGYGNGTFNGTIALVVTSGYISGEAVAVAAPAAAPDVIGGWVPVRLRPLQPAAFELILRPLFAETFASIRFNRFQPISVSVGLKFGVAYPIRSTRLMAQLDIRSGIKQKESPNYWLERSSRVETELLAKMERILERQSEAQDLEEMRILGLL